MSSQEEDSTPGLGDGSAQKKRRGPACDKCRSKKVRCDGRPGERCSNCTVAKHECTYVSTAKKRYPDLARIEELETQLANMKKLLNKLHPGVDFTPALNGYIDDNSLWMLDPSDSQFKSRAEKQLSLPLPQPTLAIPDIGPEGLDPSDDEMNAPSALERSFKAMSLQSGPPRFLGKSSRFVFFRKAFNYRYEQAGLRPPDIKDVRSATVDKHRKELWINQPWVLSLLQLHEPPHTSFPEPDLLRSLVDIYFERHNMFVPLLHRQIFEDQILSGLHLTDEGFGSVLLLVCAIGARYSEDTRVLSDGSDSWHSAGAKWFHQVQLRFKAMNLRPPRVYDMQTCALSAMYLHGSPLNQPAWPIVGLGLRFAQEMGAHRHKRYGPLPTVDGEMMKRSFWVLLGLDRSMSSALGRTCAMQDEDFDVEPSLECDDEYWFDESGNPLFQQPPGQNSKITFFNCFTRLKQIHAFTLRTVYAINRSKVAFGRAGPQWEQDMVSEIDSALNAWKDSVPGYLQWDPHREDPVFFSQSAFLWCAFYGLQITVHRAFIPSAGKPSSIALPSLTICTNAARSVLHIIDNEAVRQNGTVGGPPYHNILFSAAIVLLLNTWGTDRTHEPSKDLLEVHKAMKLLKAHEHRWYISGRYYNILYELSNVGDLPLPTSPTPPANKRSRDVECEPSTPESSESSKGTRPIAGSKRLQAYQQQAQWPAVSPQPLPTRNTSPASTMEHTFPLAGLPPLSETSGMWPSSGTISQAYPAETQNTSYSSISSPGDIFGYGGVDNVSVEALLASASASSFMPDPSFTTFPLHTSLVGSGGVNAFNTLAESQAAQPEVMMTTNDLERDILAMWSLAPSSFDWNDWGTYATGMTELAGGNLNTDHTITNM